jgi:hypothetical protein
VPQRQAILDIAVAIGQPLASRTAIDVLLGQVGKVLLAETTLRFRPEVIRFGMVNVTSDSSQATI